MKDCFDFWIARYPRNDTGIYNTQSSLKPSKSVAVAWQYSSKGNVPGIQTRVDLNVDYDGILTLIASTPERKTYEEIAAEVWAGKWGTKDTTPTRNELLKRAGYDPKKVQQIVNTMKKA